MPTYDVKLVGREEIAEGTMAFHFDKPAGFQFKAGQAIDMILAGPEGADARHTFSIVSAPFENELAVATRMRDSAFKRRLRSLPLGAAVRIEGPVGSMTLHNSRSRAAVLIAGGIGITPFISMLRQASNDRLPHALSLVYSNRRPEDAPFIDELQTLAGTNDRLRLVATMTQMSQSRRPWNGATGAISAELLRAVGRAVTQPIYYLAGPPSMVESVREMLNVAGIDDDDIRSEEFYGY